jgi:hypothetical protein
VYLSEDNVTTTVSTLQANAVAGVHLLVGENWILNVEDPEALVAVMGGTAVTS